MSLGREGDVRVEVCLSGVASAVAAAAGGAHRIELCESLETGGLTPSAGTIALAVERVDVPVHVLIRARPGSFVYDADEIETMRRDVIEARRLGAAGVVIGALDREGRVDARSTAALIDAARPLSVTFHRAFDETLDADAALDRLVELGVDRVLTSGQALRALDGAARIRAWIERLGGAPVILPGGGVALDTARELVEATGCRELHVGSAVATRPADDEGLTRRAALGPGGSPAVGELSRVSRELVRELVESVRAI